MLSKRDESFCITIRENELCYLFSFFFCFYKSNISVGEKSCFLSRISSDKPREKLSSYALLVQCESFIFVFKLCIVFSVPFYFACVCNFVSHVRVEKNLRAILFATSIVQYIFSSS